MKKYLFSIFILLGLFTSVKVFADIVPPGYYDKKCPSYKIEATCSWSSTFPFGSRINNDCPKYESNSQCEFLKRRVSSYGGSETYCCDSEYQKFSFVSSVVSLFKNPIRILEFFLNPIALVVLILTLIIEIIVFVLLKLREKKTLILFIIANLTSVSFFMLFGEFWSGLTFIFLAELLIFLFEAFFMISFDKKHERKKLIRAVLIANLVSAAVGTPILFYIQSQIQNLF